LYNLCNREWENPLIYLWGYVTMTKSELKEYILKFISRKGFIRIGDLKKEKGVCFITAKKYLTLLEEQDFLESTNIGFLYGKPHKAWARKCLN